MLSERSLLFSLLARHGLRPSKGLGQHFLADETVLRAITDATGAGPDSDVVEIGAGVGNLTTLLGLTGARVTAVEIDPKFQPLHREIVLADSSFGGRVEFSYGDALAFDYPAASARAAAENRRFLIAGNIPYQITSPLIMTILESGAWFDSMTLLMQREVAERLTARPGGKTIGAISIKIQYDCTVSTVLDVPADAFLPPPEVDSQLVRFILKGERDESGGKRRSNPEERKALFRLVDAAFSHRRKMLSNSIVSNGLAYTKDQIEAALRQIGFQETARAEQLGVEEFLGLLKHLEG